MHLQRGEVGRLALLLLDAARCAMRVREELSSNHCRRQHKCECALTEGKLLGASGLRRRDEESESPARRPQALPANILRKEEEERL